MNWSSYDSSDWLGFEWTEWLSLHPDDGDLSTIPADEGVYRIRHLERDGLEYVGETGRSLRGRVRALARGAYAEEMPYRDPHVGAPCMWAIHREYGPAFEISYSTPPEAANKAHRKSIEAALIASYRRATGDSPTGNFSRIIDGYRMSTYSRKKQRGGPLPAGESEPYSERGIAPLQWDSYEDPTASDWMGLQWSTPTMLADVNTDIPATDGVYRIWDANAPLPLEYIGESANLRSRLRTHSRNRRDDLLFSYTATDLIDAKHKRLEAETDLIGSHWMAVGEPPSDQH